MLYGTVFWGNAVHSRKAFYIEKKIVRIMTGTKRRAASRKLFKKFIILPLTRELLPSLLFIICSEGRRNI
jgi:hypothetical protein